MDSPVVGRCAKPFFFFCCWRITRWWQLKYFYFHPEPWEDEPILTNFFKWVETTNQITVVFTHPFDVFFFWVLGPSWFVLWDIASPEQLLNPGSWPVCNSGPCPSRAILRQCFFGLTVGWFMDFKVHLLHLYTVCTEYPMFIKKEGLNTEWTDKQ